MTEWVPATEAESAMRDALRSGDQEHYFRILARIELLLPVSTDALAGRAPIGWGTWTSGKRTHVLAFSSPEAMAACLAENAGSARRVPYHELAQNWPNHDWWLAVNPGLPIEGYLPAWFVAQLARGDVRLPSQPAPPRARMERVESFQRSQAVPAPAPRAALPAAEPAAPLRSGQAHGEAPLRSGQAHGDAPVSHAAGTASVGAASVSVGRAVVGQPGLSQAGAGRPGAGQAGAGEAAPWQADPRAQPESPRRLPALPRRVPRPIEEPPEAGSVGSLAEAGHRTAEPVGYRAVDAAGHRTAEPVGYRAAEPAMPQAAMPQATPRPAPAAEPAFVPANDVEAGLLAAAEQNNTDQFLSTLLLAKVLVPTPPGAPVDARPGDERFGWLTDTQDGQPYVVVFTSPERLVDHLGEPCETVLVGFVQLIRHWPDKEWSFAVNPGTPVGAKLPGAQIVALASWAAEVGLTGEPTGEFPVAPAVARREAATPPPAAAGPTMMQKVIPPGQVAFYLERGYDRVSGFVYRAAELAHLGTPSELFTALGLKRRDTSEAHVLRWAAHRPNLYRIPYGGQHEAGMRAMQGWVIERPPFRGNGFAPGESSDIIAEFKVDSVRLPHGAQLWRLAEDGTETLVALFDADVPQWRRVDGSQP